MPDDYDMILVYITNVTNVDRKHELNYLINHHQDIIIASDINLSLRRNTNIAENPLWILIENNGKGIYLASKIYNKFKPWISMGLVKNLYFHDFPEEFREMKKWDSKKNQSIMKMKLHK